uniref:Importin N-terminal domain-containing protein n=1 Tax=Amazona collaria TaxID=241587 RepID=A0A8B9FDF4_9PSIT
MDPNTIIEALRGTMDPALREAAERQLNEAHKSVNFVSTLLQITMSEQLDLPVRQAGKFSNLFFFFHSIYSNGAHTPGYC